MLITVRHPQTGELTATGQLLQSAGLSALPDSFNVDDGFVERGRQQAMVDHPQLTNTDWVNLGCVYAARDYASTHPATGKCVTCHENPLEHNAGGTSDDHQFVQPKVAFVEPGHPVSNAMHEFVHGVPLPVYVDASDKKAAAAERKEAELKKLPKAPADDHGSMSKEQVEAVSGGAQTVVVPDTAEETEAIAYVVSRGYEEATARDIVKRHGGATILADKKEDEAAKAKLDADTAPSGQPSADDLDQVAEEEQIKEATGKKNGPKPAKVVKPN